MKYSISHVEFKIPARVGRVAMLGCQLVLRLQGMEDSLTGIAGIVDSCV